MTQKEFSFELLTQDEKARLGKINTLRGQMKKADPLEEKMINMDEKVSVAIDKLKEMAKIAEKLQQEIWKNTDAGKVLIDRTEKAAKELGVAPNDVPDFKKFMNSYFFIEKNINEEIEQLKKFV